jgi:hypothetical protein
MLTEATLQKMATDVSNLTNSADQILDENGYGWEIGEIHLVTKNGSNEKVKCTWKLIGGQRVLVCERG